MRLLQGGKCAICLDRDASAVDHNHDTGQVRALLCHQCNSAIGLLQEDAAIIRRAGQFVKHMNGEFDHDYE